MAGKPQQVLDIDPPNEITFTGPFTDVVTSYLKLSNPTDRQLCFKVKTTAPKQYCVRPNSGFIPPKGLVNVAVMLQPIEGTIDDRQKHKFMVQTAFVPDGETSLENIWKNATGNELMDSKMKVVFDNPQDMTSGDVLQKSGGSPMMGGTGAGGGGLLHRAAAPGVGAGVGGGDSEIRRLIDENKRLQAHLQQTEGEITSLREKVKLAGGDVSSYGGSRPSPAIGEIKFLHVIVVAVIALILGLLFGKFV